MIDNEKILDLANLATGKPVDWEQAATAAGIPFNVQERLLPILHRAATPEDVTAALRGEYQPEGSKVSVGTIHSAKGLEWPVVWLAGADEEALPETEEARRLAYVAATRAKDYLIISSASSRQGFGRLIDLSVTKTIRK